MKTMNRCYMNTTNRCYPHLHPFKSHTSVSIGHWQTDIVNGATQMLRYDVVRNFEPVSLLADTPMWIAARSTLPAKDLKGFRRNAVPPIVAARSNSSAAVARAPLNRLPRGSTTNLPGAHLRIL